MSILSTGLALGFAAQSANAALLINFSQVGSDVQATTSGSLLIVLPSTEANLNANDVLEGSTDGLLALDKDLNAYDALGSGGTIIDSGLAQNPDSFTGDSFGYSGTNNTSLGQLIADPGLKSFEGLSNDGFFTAQYSVEPNTTWTWANTTLADIGLGGLTITPFTVYTSSTTDTISFVGTAVPEPSSALMIALGGVGFILRRRR